MADKKRLIDANEAIANTYEEVYCTESEQAWLRHFIIKQQTVDAVEVVHGRWIHVPSSDMMTGKAYKCSECNTMRYGSFMPNYCSNCGAKMDGKRDGVEKC